MAKHETPPWGSEKDGKAELDAAAPRAPLGAPRSSRLLAELVDALSSSGALTPGWRAAFLAVPRHLFVPDVVWREVEDGPGLQLVRRAEQPDTWLEMVEWLLDQWSHSWAAIHHQPDQPGPYRVRQYGSRRLFDEVSAAYRGWKAAGKPPAHTWRITITPQGQRAALCQRQRG